MISQIVSLGYERRDIEELIKLLKENKVTKLVDIRERPISRKRGFSKKGLSKHLENAGICYIHIQEAGNPFHKLKVDRQKCLRLYSEYLDQHPQVIEVIKSTVTKETPVAFLCYERQHTDCHRSVLVSRILDDDNAIELVTIE